MFIPIILVALGIWGAVTLVKAWSNNKDGDVK